MTRIASLSAVMIVVSSTLALGSEEFKRLGQSGPHDAPAVSPYRALSAPGIGDVQIVDAFWAPRMKTCRKVTLPYAFEVCEKTGRISNFVKAAGRMEGKFEGIWFNDSDVYKVLQGAACELAVQHDPELDRTVDLLAIPYYAWDNRAGGDMCVWMAEDPLLAPPLPPPAGEAARVDWTQSYDAGYTDRNGAYAGGSEIMHLVPHQGRLFAANGYWMDSRWVDPPEAEKQSAQVLRLDAADGSWQVDLDMGASGDIGARYMKGNILKSVTFTSSGDGHPLSPPRNLLVMAAGNIHSLVSVWVRNERTGNWDHGVVKAGAIATGVRWVPRDMEVYRDKVTGIERIFLVLGNPGIISGVYDASQPTRIRWDEKVEFPTSGTFRTRPLGIVRANGSLLFSVGGVVYRRIDGPSPTYTEVLNLGDGVNTDVGGIRGLTTIANPHGAGESMLFLWAPHGRATSQVKRLDPDGSGGYTVHDEADLSDLMSEKLGVEVGFTLGAHSNMYPVVHPVTGKTVHLVGFQGNLRGSDHLKWQGSRLYAGALYAIRTADRTYAVHEVNGAYAPGKPILVSPRTFARSPFGDRLLFVGGHDCSGVRADDMAWIFKASLDVALGPTGDR